MRESNSNNLSHALRKLRHLYEQMVNGHVRPKPEDIARAAKGLLGPAIEELEEYERYIEMEMENLRCEVIEAHER